MYHRNCNLKFLNILSESELVNVYVNAEDTYIITTFFSIWENIKLMVVRQVALQVCEKSALISEKYFGYDNYDKSEFE